VSSSGISWAICKSTPRSRQITMPAPHHSTFLEAGRPSYHLTNSIKALKANYKYIYYYFFNINCISVQPSYWVYKPALFHAYPKPRHSTIKMGEWWRWGPDNLDVVVSRQIVGASASTVFPCSIKLRKWQAIREEVDKECSELCTTVGTVTTTAGIQIYSRIKALAVNLSRPAIGCELA